jgi:hypothetical protein
MKKHLRPMLKWWLIFCTVIFATVYAHISVDFFSDLNAADVTKLSFMIVGVFYIYMISLGVRLSKFCKNIFNKKHSEHLEKIRTHGWFISDIFMAVGFLGTLVGFIYMLNLSALSGSSGAQSVLITLTTGMRTALYTTVMALIASIIIKCTLYIIDNDLDVIKEYRKRCNQGIEKRCNYEKEE